MPTGLISWYNRPTVCVREVKGRWLTRIKGCVDASITRLEDNIKKNEETLIKVANNSFLYIEIERKRTETRKKIWEEKTTVWIIQATICIW